MFLRHDFRTFLYLLLLIFCLTSVSSSSLSERLQSKIAVKVRNAVADLELPEGTKDAFSEQYINVGRYPNDLIELLDSYMTIKKCPIRFDDEEKRILTTDNNTEDSINDKILAQLKYFRKVQEVQCTDFVLLLYKLYVTDSRQTDHIAEHVYNMIAMAYDGKTVVPGWLWKLHINLWEPTDKFGHEAWSLKIMEEIVRDLEQFRKTLTDQVSMCVKHGYTADLLILHNPAFPTMSTFAYERIGVCFNFNNEKHRQYRNKKHALPITVEHLFLINAWPISYDQWLVYEPIAYVTIEWNFLANVFGLYFQNVHRQFTCTRSLTTKPFKYVEFQQTFIDIVRIKLYCFIWVELTAYRTVNDSATNKYLYRHNSFRKKITDIVEFSYIEDKTLSRVLSLYGEIRKSNKERIEEVLKIITDEVNNILTTVKNDKYPNEIALTDLSHVDVHHDIEYNLFMEIFERKCVKFGKTLKRKLKGLTFDLLSFFINGSKNTVLSVFPEN